MKRSNFDLSHLDRFRQSGLTMAAYCRAEGIKLSVLQYHLARAREREVDAAGRFIPVAVSGRDWLTLQFGTEGLRIRLHIDIHF